MTINKVFPILDTLKYRRYDIVGHKAIHTYRCIYIYICSIKSPVLCVLYPPSSLHTVLEEFQFCDPLVQTQSRASYLHVAAQIALRYGPSRLSAAAVLRHWWGGPISDGYMHESMSVWWIFNCSCRYIQSVCVCVYINIYIYMITQYHIL